MSKKISSPFEGNSVAAAMYDALKREITGSMVFSLSFIGAGLIVVILGLVKYFSITSNLSDSSEHYDAWAWLVIATVGLIVGAIGLINILKSMVSLGTIGSSAKDAESHASPFQTQKLNRKVTAMNQSQSLKSPGMEGMAEDAGMSLRKKGKTKDKSAKNKASSDLYDKYNPQKKGQHSATPKQNAPMTEQKFDYGIHEKKELTFADEFLQKNKRDPFAQYRKDLGLKEEQKKVHEQKPQFIPSVQSQNAHANVPNQGVQLSKSDANTNEQTLSGLDLQIPTNEATVFDDSLVSTNEQPTVELSYFEESPTQTQSSVNLSKHDDTHSNDGMFFSARTQSAAITQQPQQTRDTVKNSSASVFKVDESHSRKVIDDDDDDDFLDLDIGSPNTGKYDFSLFEEIEPIKSKKLRPTEKRPAKSVSAPLKKSEPKAEIVTETADSVQKAEPQALPQTESTTKQKVEPIKMKTIADADSSDQDALIFQSMFESDDDDDDDFFGGVFETNTIQENEEESAGLSYEFTESPLELHEVHIANNAPIANQTSEIASASTNTQVQTVVATASTPTTAQNDSYFEDSELNFTTVASSSEKYNFEAFEERPREKNEVSVSSTQQNEQPKQSFSATFLNRQKSKAQPNNGNSQTYEICTNGTRSQRKFVDASEYDEWNCSQCGKTNQEYVGVCACGSRKPRVKKH